MDLLGTEKENIDIRYYQHSTLVNKVELDVRLLLKRIVSGEESLFNDMLTERDVLNVIILASSF